MAYRAVVVLVAIIVMVGRYSQCRGRDDKGRKEADRKPDRAGSTSDTAVGKREHAGILCGGVAEVKRGERHGGADEVGSQESEVSNAGRVSVFLSATSRQRAGVADRLGAAVGFCQSDQQRVVFVVQARVVRKRGLEQ
jgi:hypothetical protein